MKRGKRSALAGLLVGLAYMLPATSMAQGVSGADRIPPPNDRTQVTTMNSVRVTTAVPSADETNIIFGVPLYRQNIQPVWVQIENLSEETLWFLPVGLDEAYFTPIETSYRRQGRIRILNFATNVDFYSKSMRLRIDAGRTRAGYIYSRVDQGTKSFNVDVMSADEHFLMTFFVPVPGLRLDHYDVDFENMFSEEEIENVDLAGLAAGLEALPCCVMDEDGEDFGDPLNIVVIGSLRDIYYAFMRAGWDETETVYGGSSWRFVQSSLFGKENRYSPVSALYVYGRAQDVALQKARESLVQRNHLRLWLTPMQYDGKLVFIGQISRDIGFRWTWKTVMTHKIDGNVDDTRDYLVEDLAYAQSLGGLGYAHGVGPASYDEPRFNLAGDAYFTDGLRAVMFLSSDLVSISELETYDLGASVAATDAEPLPKQDGQR